MSPGLISPPIDHRPPPTAVDGLAASLAPVAGDASARPAAAPHRRRAAALIRQLRGRTDTALRRELDRFFAARPDLGRADRAAIARALSRFRNELLRRPRSTLRAAAAAPDPAGAHPLLDAVRRVFGLADAPHSDPAAARTPDERRGRRG
jgi:glutamyl-tRNA reductase